jgi:DNA-binding LacI/PurR family transcriptional regulator
MRSTSELADALGLSRWTVSRVLNGHPGVRETTRQRVLQAIERSGFQPSVLARGLRGGRTGLVGISFQEMDSPVRARKASVLQSQLRARGMRGIMELNSHDPALERIILRHFLDLKVDAIVLFGAYMAPDDPLLTEIAESGPPLLVVDPPCDLPVTTIGLDRGLAISEGLRHLHALGHRRFALLGLMHDAVYGPMRLAGLDSTARQLGLDPQEAFVAINDEASPTLDYASGSQLTERLLKEQDPPRAIIALNDCLAIGAMHALQSAGWRVPEDFSVLGFDDIGVAAWVRPSLTTLSQEVESLSEAAVEWLEAVLTPDGEEKKAPRSTQLSPKLIVRESTGPAPS